MFSPYKSATFEALQSIQWSCKEPHLRARFACDHDRRRRVAGTSCSGYLRAVHVGGNSPLATLAQENLPCLSSQCSIRQAEQVAPKLWLSDISRGCIKRPNRASSSLSFAAGSITLDLTAYHHSLRIGHFYTLLVFGRWFYAASDTRA